MMGLFQKFRDGLRKTSTKLATEIKRIVTRSPRLDTEALDELEAALIAADFGVATATAIMERVRDAGQPDVLAIASAEVERELGVATHQLSQAAEPPTAVVLARPLRLSSACRRMSSSASANGLVR